MSESFFVLTTTIDCRMLRKGVHHRATGSTDVNATSSRSHAIFSVLLKQQIANQESSATDSQPSIKRLASKFHFVDLAGSERVRSIYIL